MRLVIAIVLAALLQIAAEHLGLEYHGNFMNRITARMLVLIAGALIVWGVR